MSKRPWKNKEIEEYLQNFTGSCREDEIAKWREQSKTAEEEARKLSESLKESREAKLFRKRKRTDSQPNLMLSTSKQVLLPTPKQPHLQHNQPTDLIEALTGLINIYKKKKSDHNSNETTNSNNTQAEGKALPTGKDS